MSATPEQRLPNFLVIGAMKAGTTSLHAHLRSHPQVFMPEQKELDFFVAERNWGRGLDWYASHFAGAAGASARGEVSPNYTKIHLFSGVAERIRDVLPHARLIYVVRDPIARMRSHYVHALAEGQVRMPIHEALLDHDHLLLCSSYALQLEPFLQRFPREQLLILSAERLRDHTRGELARVFDFIGVDSSFEPPEVGRELHRGEEKRVPRTLRRRWPILSERLETGAPKPVRALVRRVVSQELDGEQTRVSAEVERELRRRLQPDMKRLRDLAGDELAGWEALRGLDERG